MHILLTGLNHKTAPLDVRERVSFSKEQLPAALPSLAAEAGQGIILSTCNRTEIYTVTEEPADSAKDVRGFISRFHGVDVGLIAPHLYELSDADAVSHLFSVASGLDSLILGESEILGQVREALRAGSSSGSLRPDLSRLFHRAIRTGRRVRDETDLGRNALSMSYAAVQLAQRVIGELQGRQVLLIGAGEAGQLVARALQTTGASQLLIANRTQARSQDLAEQLGGLAIPFSEIVASLEYADIVIAATAAPDYVLSRDEVTAVGGARNGRPLFLFDLSVPRNIDPSSAAVESVTLFNIDDLSSVAEENLRKRKDAAVGAERIIEEEAGKFISWWDSLEAVDLIRALRERSERTRAQELERARPKMSELSESDAEVLDALTRSIVNRILHDPTISLREVSGEMELQAARDLFRLWGEEPSDAGGSGL